jgi:F0F1-type ATP synthase assembly protein I
MRSDDGERSPGRSLERLNENLRRAGPAATASYSLIGAILLFAGLGYVLDLWLQTSPWFMIGGLMFGLVVGFYQLAMMVWRR